MATIQYLENLRKIRRIAIGLKETMMSLGGESVWYDEIPNVNRVIDSLSLKLSRKLLDEDDSCGGTLHK